MLERKRIFNTNAAKGSMHPICKNHTHKQNNSHKLNKQKKQKNGHNPDF